MPEKTKKALIVIATLIVISIIGLTYAFLARQPIEGNLNNTIILSTIDFGRITVTYENDNNQIQASNLDLIEANAGTNNYYMIKFQINSTANVTQDIQIRWKDLVNTFCQYRDNDYECDDPDTTGTFVGDDLSYQLYSCTSTQYTDITTPDDTDITSCNKISALTDVAIPVTGSQTQLHTSENITLQPNSTTYYVVRVILKNLNSNQNYNMGDSLDGAVTVIFPPSTLAEHAIYNNMLASDAIASAYVTSETGIDFSAISSPTNGQGLYINDKANVANDPTTGLVKYFRGGNYCLLNNSVIDTADECKSILGSCSNSNYSTMNSCIQSSGICSLTDYHTYNSCVSYHYNEFCSDSRYDTESDCEEAGEQWYVEAEQGYWTPHYTWAPTYNWTNYHCSISDSKESCETAGGTYYELKNNVKFANKYWKIIRIDEDGNIRLLYNGNATTATGTDAQYGESAFNSSYDDAAYVGYMIPNFTGNTTSVLEATRNDTDSTIKGLVEDFYDEVLGSYTDKIANSSYCGDRSITSGPGFGKTGDSTYYGARTRLQTNKTPTYSCPSSNDLYTMETSLVGNKKLTKSIGLLTADEVAYAGGKYLINNATYYLQSGAHYWTMSPSLFSPTYGQSTVWSVLTSGDTNGNYVYYDNGLRPVIALKPETLVTSGTGTLTDPWIVATN